MKGRFFKHYLLLASLALLSLFSSVTLAAYIPTVLVSGNPIHIEHFYAGYFIDPTGEMSFEEVKDQSFTASSNKLSLGIKAHFTWVKIKLQNTNKHPIKLYLHHPQTYHNRSLSLYEVTRGKLIRTRLLDSDDKATHQWMYRGIGIFDIELQPQELRTLYVKSETFSHQWLSLFLYDEEQSKRALQDSFSDIALMVGMLLALVVYNILLFFSSRRKESLFYACYLVSSSIWIALSYGLLANWFGIYGSVALYWQLTLMGMPIFLILFMINVFETKTKYPLEHWALCLMMALLSIEFVYGIFNIRGALLYSSSLAALMMVVTTSVGISLQIKKNPIARYFLFGHMLFVAFSGLAVLFYKGIAEFSYLASHGVGVGVMLESLVLATIIAYRVKLLESMKANQEELKLLAATDPMTQLYNRRYFNTEADFQLELAKQSKQPLSIAVLDIDFFKRVNDNYGHAVGDQVIIQVAKSLKELCRTKDIVARFGGEEFVVLLPNTAADDAFNIIENIRRSLGEMVMQVEGKNNLTFTISAGVSAVAQRQNGIEKALAFADDALYEAKNSGRNRSCLYHDE
ncbi:sensor domain-containing diguanylate cyclase [Marinomonas transparens]|uniref:diguanylate cyclase n=1 Tax=Marinomonas transparens TaxID=2795388 RepID=A0A934JPR7_9GAMM|nr:diguanylate cyclase [Marinomonas transparens]MBJ7536177.1 GGDEF domain-containing protein [Marinomonas transparens]